MRSTEVALALGLTMTGCPAGSDEGSYERFAECDRAREPVKAIFHHIPPGESEPCADVQNYRELVHDAAVACGASPSIHLALAHMERLLRDARPDCF